MGTKKKLAKNVIFGFSTQIINLILSFVIRTLFVKNIGVELLGISSVVVSLIQTLSLTELGFYAAVMYRLYKPLTEENYEECNDIIYIFKRIYEVIAVIITILIFILTPFLHIFFKDIEINKTVYFTYFLMGGNTVISYLLAYKRTLIYADRKDYIAKIVDTTTLFIVSILKAIIIIKFKNYFIYTGLTVLQTFSSNLIIHLRCNSLYKWIHKTKINKQLLKILLKDTSLIFAGRLASYVLNSTDNLVISAFISTTAVGLYSNYLIVTSALQSIYYSIVQQVVPFIGRDYAITKDTEHHQKIINVYTFLRFIIAGCICIPFLILIDGFIAYWIGSEYLIQNITVCISIHLYIQILYSTFTDYISCSGSFKYDRNNSIIGASINIISSLILVRFFGITGVLMGTIMSEFFTWIFCGIIVFEKIIVSDVRYVTRYILNNILYILITVLIYLLLNHVLSLFAIKIFIVDFIIKGLICILSFLFINFCLFFRSNEMKFIFSKINLYMGKKRIA